MEIYVVKAGDSVDLIASAYKVPVNVLIYVNQLEPPYPLAIGQALLIPTMLSEPERPLQTGGYSYSYISRENLEAVLPFLTNLYVFPYGFDTEGSVLPPTPDDQFMINTAKGYGTAPILTITPIDSTGMFNNVLIHEVINSPEKTDILISNLLSTVNEKGFEGIDIDFEYILPEDRLPYVEFVKKVHETFSPLGYPVSVALAPKTSADQRGVLYEGKDYRLLGEAADSVLLMTYEWGYTFSEPRAVAPINEVRKVVEYALSEIPKEKIKLGIPNYGYDWKLPYEKGVSRATAISNKRAIDLAIQNDAEIQFDPVAMTPHFSYERDGSLHEVWFEDVRSYQAKYNLILEYDLMGTDIWQVMTFFRPAWILLESMFSINKNSPQ